MRSDVGRNAQFPCERYDVRLKDLFSMPLIQKLTYNNSHTVFTCSVWYGRRSTVHTWRHAVRRCERRVCRQHLPMSSRLLQSQRILQ